MDNEYYNTINEYYNTFDGWDRVESCVERCRIMGSGGEVVTSPLFNRKVGCSRPTMIRTSCLRAQKYPAQKNNQKKYM